MISLELKVINEGGAADQHRIRLADAAEMYSGFSRAVSYCLLALEAQTLVERATRVASVQLYQQKTGDGSLIHDLAVEITQHPGSFYAGIAASIAGDYLRRFIELCFKSALGMLSEGEYDRELKKYERIEPLFDDLSEKIEPQLLSMHAPIQESETVTVELGELKIILNKETKDYLAESNVSPTESSITGVVTRLNTVTGNGRFRSGEFGRIVPFSQTIELRRRPASKELSWSLRENDQNRPADVQVTLKRVTSSTGRVKRLILSDVRRRQ